MAVNQRARYKHGYGRVSLLKISGCSKTCRRMLRFKLKAIFQKIPKTQTKVFSFRNTKEHCADLEWFLQRYPMEMTVDARAELERGRSGFVEDRNAIEDILLPSWQPGHATGFKPGFAPVLIQSQAIEITRRLGRLLVIDDAGLGKTWTAMGTIMDPKLLPAAVIVKTHLATQWQKKFIEPYTHLRRTSSPARLRIARPV